MDFDVIVIGAGLSGLTCASTLKKANPALKIGVLEARDRVGGRNLTIQSESGVAVDLGGQWIGHTHKRLRQLAGELGVEVHMQHHQGLKVLDIDGKVSTYSGHIPSTGVMSLAPLQVFMMKIEQLAQQVSADDPLTNPQAKWLDSITAQTLFEMYSSNTAVLKLAEAVVRGVMGVEPSEISALHLAMYSASSGGFETMIKIVEGHQEGIFIGGAQQLSQKLSKRLAEQGVKVLLNSPVDSVTQLRAHPAAGSNEEHKAIEYPDDGVRVDCIGGRSYTASYACVALPPAISGKIRYQPRLPPSREMLQQRAFMGSIIKVIVLYEKAYWREAGFSGEVVSDVVDNSPVFNVFDDCLKKSDGTLQPGLVCFMNADAARHWTRRTQAERKAAVVRQLVRWFGPDMEKVQEYHEKDWLRDEWAAGCPIGIWPTGALWAAGHALREPVGRIHWAGTELSRQFQGFMEGALESGARAADEILRRLQNNGNDPQSKHTSSAPDDLLDLSPAALRPDPMGSALRSHDCSDRHPIVDEGFLALPGNLFARLPVQFYSPWSMWCWWLLLVFALWTWFLAYRWA